MPSTCWVYVIAKCDGKGGYSNPVKVGISQNVDTRLATFQTACPFEIGVAWIFELPDRMIAAEIEKAFHHVQSRHRLKGEWFDLHPIVTIHLLCMCIRTCLQATIKDDPKLIENSLDRAGVLWAEKKFALNLLGTKQ